MVSENGFGNTATDMGNFAFACSALLAATEVVMISPNFPFLLTCCAKIPHPLPVPISYQVTTHPPLTIRDHPVIPFNIGTRANGPIHAQQASQIKQLYVYVSSLHTPIVPNNHDVSIRSKAGLAKGAKGRVVAIIIYNRLPSISQLQFSLKI